MLNQKEQFMQVDPEAVVLRRLEESGVELTEGTKAVVSQTLAENDGHIGRTVNRVRQQMGVQVGTEPLPASMRSSQTSPCTTMLLTLDMESSSSQEQARESAARANAVDNFLRASSEGEESSGKPFSGPAATDGGVAALAHLDAFVESELGTAYSHPRLPDDLTLAEPQGGWSAPPTMRFNSTSVHEIKHEAIQQLMNQAIVQEAAMIELKRQTAEQEAERRRLSEMVSEKDEQLRRLRSEMKAVKVAGCGKSVATQTDRMPPGLIDHMGSWVSKSAVAAQRAGEHIASEWKARLPPPSTWLPEAASPRRKRDGAKFDGKIDEPC